ncbi:MAG TPA: thioesterase family protein [Geminicoccaceae bacterium]
MSTARTRLAARGDYRAFYPVPTRWMDNDVYGHVNNVHYYSYFDTAIAHFLIREGGLDPWRDPVIGYCVESSCRFDAGLRFPDPVTAGLRVHKLGRSSCVYLIGIFRGDEEVAAATGDFVHVFVDRASERPVAIPAAIRAALERLHDPA